MTVVIKCGVPSVKQLFLGEPVKLKTVQSTTPITFEFMRSANNGEIPRQPGDLQPCDIVPGFNTLWNNSNRWRRSNPTGDKRLSDKVMNFFRFRVHFQRIDINRVDNNYQDVYTQYRVRYLLKDIDENEFMIKIRRCLRKEEKDSEILQIYNLYYNVTGEILKNVNQLLINNSSSEEIFDQLESSKKVKNFCNEKLEILSKQFKNNIRMIKN